MQLRNLFTDERGVSPVIGVILMVAITVILAAVIGTFVLGLGDQVSNTSPSASFSFDYDSGASQLTVTHDGGDELENSNIAIKDDGDGVTVSSPFPTSIGAGDSATVDGVESGNTIRVVWESPNGGDTATLGKWAGPDA